MYDVSYLPTLDAEVHREYLPPHIWNPGTIQTPTCAQRGGVLKLGCLSRGPHNNRDHYCALGSALGPPNLLNLSNEVSEVRTSLTAEEGSHLFMRAPLLSGALEP